MTKTLLETEGYNLTLYKNMLEKIEDSDYELKLSFPKWERDVLLILLCRAKPNVKRKYLRKKISLDLDRISEKTWKEIEEE